MSVIFPFLNDNLTWAQSNWLCNQNIGLSHELNYQITTMHQPSLFLLSSIVVVFLHVHFAKQFCYIFFYCSHFSRLRSSLFLANIQWIIAHKRHHYYDSIETQTASIFTVYTHLLWMYNLCSFGAVDVPICCWIRLVYGYFSPCSVLCVWFLWSVTR